MEASSSSATPAALPGTWWPGPGRAACPAPRSTSSREGQSWSRLLLLDEPVLAVARNVYSPCLSLQPLGPSWSAHSRQGQTEQCQGVCTAPPLPVYSSHTSVGSVAAISYLSPMLPPSKRSLWSCHQPGHCTQPYTGQQALH